MAGEQVVEFSHSGAIMAVYADGVIDVLSDIDAEQMADVVESLIEDDGAVVLTPQGHVLTKAGTEKTKDQEVALAYLGGMLADAYQIGQRMAAVSMLGGGAFAPHEPARRDDAPYTEKPGGYL